MEEEAEGCVVKLGHKWLGVPGWPNEDWDTAMQHGLCEAAAARKDLVSSHGIIRPVRKDKEAAPGQS